MRKDQVDRIGGMRELNKSVKDMLRIYKYCN